MAELVTKRLVLGRAGDGRYLRPWPDIYTLPNAVVICVTCSRSFSLDKRMFMWVKLATYVSGLEHRDKI